MGKNKNKAHLGQFFTIHNLWLRPQVREFIYNSKKNTAYDPFAGNGDLLKAVRDAGLNHVVGLDIDIELGWKFNDSLIHIPRIDNAIVITNPPYLTNYSAKRKKIYDHVSKYFENSKQDDLYKIAIEKCMINDYGIMIIPETFINSTFPKSRINSITILEENPFHDTENPVCVVCFDDKQKPLDEIRIYKNDLLLGNLNYFEKHRLKPKNNIKINFNNLNGGIALRAVDTTNPKSLISFMKREELEYDLSGIKHSSRLITLIDVPGAFDKVDEILDGSNQILNEWREKTYDILLSPFKGNRKDGKRRRRLDYSTARAILELASEEAGQLRLVS